MDEMAWWAVPRIQRQAQHLLCHIQARVNVGSFVPASSSGPAGSIRMEADGGQFDGTRPDQAGPEKDGKPLHSAGGLARPDGPLWSDQSGGALSMETIEQKAGFRSRQARSPYVVKTDEIRYLDMDGAALDQIANLRLSKIVYSQSDRPDCRGEYWRPPRGGIRARRGQYWWRVGSPRRCCSERTGGTGRRRGSRGSARRRRCPW